MATKEAQMNLRLPADLDAWVEARAGGRRAKPGFVRDLLERERAREEEERMVEMFNSAWDSLSLGEKRKVAEEREAWLRAYSGRSRK